MRRPAVGALPAETLRALAAGGGGDAAARVLRAGQSARRLLLLRGVLETARAHPRAGAARAGWDLLAALQRDAPAAFDRVVHHPSVGPAARRVLRAGAGAERAGGPGDPGPALLASLGAAGAVLAGLRAEVEVPVPGGLLVLPSLGCAAVPGARSVLVRAGGGGAEIVPESGAPIRFSRAGGADGGWSPVRTLTAGEDGEGIRLLLDEGDPDRMPGAALRAGRLPAAEAARWGALLEEAWTILLRRHWTTAQEVRVLVRALTPLDAPPGRAASGTPRHAAGLIGLSAPADAPALAETLAHEIQHTKLNAILDHHALTAPDDGTRYHAPWRADPRPLLGLLHGAYAHLGVAGYWRRERARAGRRAREGFDRWCPAAHAAALTLAESGRLTAEGSVLVAGMTATLTRWLAESGHDGAARTA